MKLDTQDADEFSDFLLPTSGRIGVQPTSATTFHANVELARQGRLGLFWMNASAFRVTKEPPHEFLSLTIPLGTPFTIHSGSRHYDYDQRSAFLLPQEQYFDLQSDEKHSVLVMNVFDDKLHEKTRRLLGLENEQQIHYKPRLNLLDANMSSVLRGLASTVRELAQAGLDIPASEILSREREDTLITHLMLAAQDGVERRDQSIKKLSVNRLVEVEEYLAANIDSPVERWKLAEIADTSIRNLSRCFLQRYGMGPMAFLKQRRLDMCYMELLGARSGEVAVTDIALKYGFNHLGRFAFDFSHAFGEPPSKTLQH